MDEAARWREVRRIFEELLRRPQGERLGSLAALPVEPSIRAAVQRLLMLTSPRESPSHERVCSTATS